MKKLIFLFVCSSLTLNLYAQNHCADMKHEVKKVLLCNSSIATKVITTVTFDCKVLKNNKSIKIQLASRKQNKSDWNVQKTFEIKNGVGIFEYSNGGYSLNETYEFALFVQEKKNGKFTYDYTDPIRTSSVLIEKKCKEQ